MNNLKEKQLKNDNKPLLLYGITPPRKDIDENKLHEINAKRIDRIKKLPIDGLVVYDVQDESLRNNEKRPFPYIATIDAFSYVNLYLNSLSCDKIIYKPVSNQDAGEFKKWLNSPGILNNNYVFVGSPSTKLKPQMSLDDAYKIIAVKKPEITFGAIMIPERHQVKNNEHERVINKSNQGASFFISQCVYNIELTKNYLSDYYYFCKNNSIAIQRQVFTFTPCGSVNTLNFMKWLGISIPKWLENELNNSTNILEKSIEENLKNIAEIIKFCKEKNIPYGINIESVSIKKEEIDASIYMIETASAMLKNN